VEGAGVLKLTRSAILELWRQLSPAGAGAAE